MKLFAFDFDGTLADSFSLITDCFARVFEDMNSSLTTSDLHSHFGPNEEGICRELFAPEEVDKAFGIYLKYYEQLHEKDVPMIDVRLLDLLKEIKKRGFPLCLLTGRHMKTAEISLRKFGMENIFDKIYTGSLSGVNKPKNFAKLCKDFHLYPEEVLYVGDSLKDVASCKEAGVNLVSVNYYHTVDPVMLAQLNPDTCYTIDGLVNRIRNIMDESQKA